MAIRVLRTLDILKVAPSQDFQVYKSELRINGLKVCPHAFEHLAACLTTYSLSVGPRVRKDAPYIRDESVIR